MAQANSIQFAAASLARARPGIAMLRAIDLALCVVCVVIVSTFATLLIAQVGLRQLGQPLFWIEELCQFLMIYLCFLGSAIAWGRREHLTVDFLPTLLPDGGRVVLKVIVDLIVMAFACWAFYVSLEFALFSMRKTSISMDVPIGYGYLGAPAGFAIIALQSLIFIVFCKANIQIAPGKIKMEEVGM